jgi:Smg protein
MFDILLYLYDTYLTADQFPDAEHLSRKLSAAGFENEDIAEALDWLAGLEDLVPVDVPGGIRAMRLYSDEEERRLDIEGRGFLAFLESADLLPPHGREWVIERALALPEARVPGECIKWIAMLALWKLNGAGEALWLEDLVRGADDGWQPTFH